MNTNNHVNYIEFTAVDLEKIKTFYSNTFGWVFTDYGPNYVSFSNSGIEGGFEKVENTVKNGVLVVLYHENLESIHDLIINFKGQIVKNTFSFPGGRRFHFTDPSGNELAVWSDN